MASEEFTGGAAGTVGARAANGTTGGEKDWGERECVSSGVVRRTDPALEPSASSQAGRRAQDAGRDAGPDFRPGIELYRGTLLESATPQVREQVNTLLDGFLATVP
ncbi:MULTISPECIES: hypothetical protein [Corallococcus]|uniref:hypothetical protein n=1 Tax=Corallococcus TaxID=83461 RepID=UPI0011C3DE79|nr:MULTISPECIES: hypothetical protein [Corallococcus]NPD21877.1 hypothetical protein [Corallococcus exiguus]